MGIFDFIKSGDSVEKNLFAWDKESLMQLNQEELDTEFRFMSAQFTRMREKAGEVAEVMVDKGYAVPTDCELGRVLQKREESKEEDTLDLGGSTELPENIVKGRGPVNATVAFVGASPSKLDSVRKRTFSGPVGRTIKSTYLPPLGVSESNVFFTNIVPEYLEDEHGNPREPNQGEIDKYEANFLSELDRVSPSFVVALGKTAADSLEGYDEWLPHPRAVMKMGDTGEVERKMTRLASRIEDAVSKSSSRVNARIAKVDEEKRLVYGIVIEPEVEDSDGNWATVEEIEKAAHRFAEAGMSMTHEHVKEVNDSIVVENYVTPQEMDFDGTTVKKGTWIAVSKVLSDERWEKVKSGEYTGYSFGGTANIIEESRL